LKLHDVLVGDPSTGHGREGFYFATNGEFSMCDLAGETTAALVDLGRVKSTSLGAFTEEELRTYFPMTFIMPILPRSKRASE
jgi:hypothetical protein